MTRFEIDFGAKNISSTIFSLKMWILFELKTIFLLIISLSKFSSYLFIWIVLCNKIVVLFFRIQKVVP